MKASTVMFAAIGALVIGRWAHNKKAADPQMVIEGLFAVLVIAFLDQGKTEPIAKGFAWLFLAAVLLGKDSPVTVVKNAPNIAQAAGKSLKDYWAPGGVQLGKAGKAAGNKLVPNLGDSSNSRKKG